MRSSPSISVIVPVYKVEPWLGRCVQSILAQTFRDFELLLVDDGSPDRCGTLCDEWATKDPRIRVFHKPNGGLSDARNHALDRMHGKFVVFVDSDDWAYPDLLHYLVGLHAQDDRCLYAECSFDIVRHGRSITRDGSGTVEKLNRHDALARIMYDEGLYFSAWGKLFPARLFKDFRFPKGKVYEDTYLIKHALAQDGNIVYGAQPLSAYAIREDSITTAAFSPRNFTDHFDAMRRFAASAVAAYPDLAPAARRLLAFSRMRALRALPPAEHRALAQRLRAEVLDDAPALLSDQRLPRRDRMGIRCLRLGLPFYGLAWKVYTALRDFGK